MIVASRSSFIIRIFAVVFLVLGSARVQAQSSDSARKRSFAELLSRRADRPAIRSDKADAVRSTAVRPAADSKDVARFHRVPGRSLNGVPPLRSVGAPVGAGSGNGTSSATPVTPVTASQAAAAGRTAGVGSLFTGILGAGASPAEMEHFTRLLARGVPLEDVASIIWTSRAHRTLVREGLAPNISYREAYRAALAADQAASRIGRPVRQR